MDLIGAANERGLAYLVMLDDEGEAVSVAEFDAFVSRAEVSGLLPAQLLLGLDGYSMFGREKPSDMFQALGWAVVVNYVSLRPTELGRTLSRALARTARGESEEPSAVLIDPDSPFAYSRVLTAIAEHEDALVVDPYLEPREFHQLIASRSVTRILTGTRKGLGSDIGVQHALAARGDEFQMRTVDQSRLHDRYVLSASKVTILGSSLNSIATRPGVLVPLGDAIAATAMRDAYEELWAEGNVVEHFADVEVGRDD